MTPDNPLSDSPGLQPAGSANAAIDPQGAVQLAAALQDATKAAGELVVQTERLNRLTRNSPAVRAARERTTADRLSARERSRGQGQPAGGVSGLPASVSGRVADPRHNPDLDAAFGVVALRPHPPGMSGQTPPPPTLPPPATSHLAPPPVPAPALTQPATQAGLTAAQMLQMGAGRAVVPDRAPPARNAASEAAQVGTGGDASTNKPREFAVTGTDSLRRPSPAKDRDDKETPLERLQDKVEFGRRGLEAAGQLAELNKLSGSPFMTASEAERRQAEGIPGLGWALQSMWSVQENMTAKDVKAHHNSRVYAMTQDVRSNVESASYSREVDMMVARAKLQAEMDARENKNPTIYGAKGPSPGYERPPAMFGAHDGQPGAGKTPPELFARNRLAEQQKYAERMTIQPARDQQFLAYREQAVADRTFRRLDDAIKGVNKELEKQKGLLAADQRKLKEADTPDKNNNVNWDTIRNRAADVAARAQKIDSMMQDRDRLETEYRDARMNALGAGQRVKAANRAVAAAELPILEEKEATAATQSRRLGMLGVDGRLQTMLAKRTLDQIGIENSPQELIAQAAVGFPETIANDAERAGQKFVPQFRRQGPTEYEDDLDDMRKRVDELRETVRNAELTSVSDSFKEAVDIIKTYIDDFKTNELDRIKAIVDKLQTDLVLRNQR